VSARNHPAIAMKYAAWVSYARNDAAIRQEFLGIRLAFNPQEDAAARPIQSGDARDPSSVPPK
jgi:hypothetical protein